MKRIFHVVLCGVLLAPAVAFSACGGDEARSSYAISAEYFPEERRLVAEMTFTYVNVTENALEELRFSLPANAYREGALYPPVSALYAPAAYYAGESYGGIQIVSVEGATEYEVCGEDENVLSVALSAPVYPDESVTLGISFEVTLANINHRLGVGENAVNLANFYPVLEYYGEEGFCDYVYATCGDPFVSECADYRVSLTVPAEYTVCGAAAREEANGKATCSLEAQSVRGVAFVLGTGFSCVTEDADGVAVSYYYLNDANPARTLAIAKDSLTYFSQTFGEYAYPQYVVVETDFPYGGMEYPMLSMIAPDLKESETPLVVVHETAHQWWYAMVGSNQFEEAWQDEGLAEYSAALFFEEYPEYGYTYKQFVAASESSYRAFFSVRSQISGEADTRMSRSLTEYSGEYEYRNIAYDKGVILFDNLKAAAGDKKFFSAIRDYCSRYEGKIASPADLASCFERAGARVEELMASFLEGKCVI